MYSVFRGEIAVLGVSKTAFLEPHWNLGQKSAHGLNLPSSPQRNTRPNLPIQVPPATHAIILITAAQFQDVVTILKKRRKTTEGSAMQT